MLRDNEKCEACGGKMSPVPSQANRVYCDTQFDREGYQVWKCRKCGTIWGCRFQEQFGTGEDDRWHNFGKVDPNKVRAHY